MAKIGVIFAKSYAGFSTGFGINDNNEWTKYVRDSREDNKCIPAIGEASGVCVLMYSAIEVGELYTIISSISGRPGDFVSAWIFVPKIADISGKSLLFVIEETKKQILSDKIDTVRLNEIFGKEYPECDIAKNCTKTSGNEYAVRYYGNNTKYKYQLEELLDMLSQPENSQYRAIFLLDKASGISAINCLDITEHLLKDTFRVEPPASVDGFEPFYNGVKFTRPQRVTEGEKMVVVWQKKNYADITTTSIITGENCRIQTINPSQYQKYISHNDIRVFGEKGSLIPDEKYTLSVNGRILERGMRVPVSVAILKEVSISVTNCQGYKDVRTTCDFTLNSPCSITLKEECFRYEFAMPLRPEIENSARVSPIIVESRYKLDRTPFEGYHSYDGYIPSQTRENRIIYRPDKKPLWKRLIIPSITFVLGIVVGLSIILSITENNRSKDLKEINKLKTENESLKATRQPSSVSTTPKPSTMDKAISLLNGNKWKKVEFEQCPELKGLWDELNSYDFIAILERDDCLLKSDKFRNIKDYVITLNNLGCNKSNFGKNYNNPGDNEITASRYIQVLKDKIDSVTEINNVKKNSTGNDQNTTDDSRDFDGWELPK